MPAQRHLAASRGEDPVFAGIHVLVAARLSKQGWVGNKLGHDGGEWFDYTETRLSCIILPPLALLVSPECKP